MAANILKKLWNDECGAIVSTELILVGTILVVGIVTGISAVRTAVVTELADVGQAVATVNQSYSLSGTVGCHAATGGSAFRDLRDTCDSGTVNGVSSRGIRMTNGSRAEGQRVLSNQVIDVRSNSVVNVNHRDYRYRHAARFLRGETQPNYHGRHWRIAAKTQK